MEHQTYTFDEMKIVYEIISNEVVLVNLDNGYYYILDETASTIWQTLHGGATIEEAVVALLNIYNAPADVVRKGIDSLIADLMQEGLLIASDTPRTDKAALPMALAPAEQKKSFFMPAIFRHTDMEYLIQMDPIWEYDETGWPTRRTNPPASQ